MILKNTTYSQNQFEKVKEIFTTNKSFAEYLSNLINLKINDLFKIYKVILDSNLNIIEEEISFSKYFYENKLNRLKKDSTFFNLLKYDKHIHYQ